ncbi:MAG: hypothetical protein ACR5K9_04920 [Wolbachia sp.]
MENAESVVDGMILSHGGGQDNASDENINGLSTKERFAASLSEKKDKRDHLIV